LGAGSRPCVEIHGRTFILVAPAADTGQVISRTLKLISLVCCLLVVVSFGLFARDQMAGASAHQQTELATGADPTLPSVVPSRPHGQPRRFIDGAAKVISAPFNAVARSGNPWVSHGVPTALALLVYGVGLGYLARYSSGLARR
jgi:hypothetical protein